jgi:Papain family cysteine protease
MEARFGRIIIQHVDKALEVEPSRDALLVLLRIADPSFTETDLGNERKRISAFRNLQLLIHPDKHSGDAKATQRFQSSQNFYEKAVSRLNQKKRKVLSPRGVDVPLQFHVQDKWKHLSKVTSQPVVPNSDTLKADLLEKLIAYKCINYRGAIAHGKQTELCCCYNDVVTASAKSAQKIFQSFGGCTSLDTIDEIKQEIMTHGPVVSTSFNLTKSFYEAGCLAPQFFPTNFGRHPLLIVGWQQAAHGEMWLVRTFKGNNDVSISIGQYSMEEEVLAPTSDLSNYPWQSEEKVYETDGLSSDWYGWPGILLHCKSDKLEALFKSLGCSMITATTRREEFVIRESKTKARSRYAYLNDIEWDEKKKKWKLSATFSNEMWA